MKVAVTQSHQLTENDAQTVPAAGFTSFCPFPTYRSKPTSLPTRQGLQAVLTVALLAICPQLVAWAAGAFEGAAGVEALVSTHGQACQALIHICKG